MNKKNTSRTARVRRPRRDQYEMQPFTLDQLLPDGHRAKVVWAFVGSLNLEPLYENIEVTRHTAGRTAIAPEVLVALWLLATLDGVGSARELERRCENHLPYVWLRGHVEVNHHTLSDFRVNHAAFLERLLVDTIASLVDRGLVPLETIAQDGMRVRANAGKSSFRRKPSLERLQREAQEHLDRLKKEADNEGERLQADARRQAAAERAARERQERIDEALRQHEKLSQQRENREKGDGEKTRVSTTDPDARTMKMANGGYDPAMNVQFATDADARMIVNVDVTNAGTDGGELKPMHDKIRSDYRRGPPDMPPPPPFRPETHRLTPVRTQPPRTPTRPPRRRNSAPNLQPAAPRAINPLLRDRFTAWERRGTKRRTCSARPWRSRGWR